MSPCASLLFLALAGAPATLTTEALAAAPRYDMVLDSATPTHGVQTVSLVANPAIQRGWVALSAAQPTTTARRFHLSEAGQRQVLTGPALIPGQEILRLDAEGNPFYIRFTAETIAAVARRYALQARHTSTNQDHETALSGNVVEESWLIRDSERDPAAVLGLAELPVGTWMLSMHIPDAEYWQNEVVSGNKTGFSIEGLFDTQQLTLSAAKPAPVSLMKGFWQKLGSVWTSLTGEQRLALGLEMLADGRAVQIDDTTGAVTLGDGSPLPDGTYPLQNGGELVVQGGLRADTGGKGAPASSGELAAGTAAGDAAAAVPAPLADTATTAEIAKAVNGILDFLKKEAPAEKKEDVASAPAAPKLATALHGVAVADLKLDAIELTEGDKLTYNAVTRRLSDSKNALVESGYYAAADGSYFQVSTSQYIWEIDKQTYDMVYGAQLQAVELAEVKAKLAKEPGGKVIKLHGDGDADAPALTPAQARLARAAATR